MQTFVKFVKINLKKNMLKVQVFVKLVTMVKIQGNIEVLHIAYVL